MNRQLRADGGIMQVAPREKFGLGSKLKKFVRKIIPNEVADIAVKAAPFVAPFNPAVAAAMSGLGTFDQTGSIGQSLKGAGMNYAGGQAARYIGGAGFQDPSLSAFTPSGFTSGFSSPLGSDTGLGKFFSNRGTEGVQAIDSSKLNTSDFAQDLTQDLLPGDTVSSVDLVSDSGSTFSNFVDYGKDLLKKGAKAAFTKPDGKGGFIIDKAAVIGAATAAASYAEALALANDAGVELTEDEYNEAQAAEKKEEYAGYLKNFFGGKKDGGRIGFNDGSDPGDIVLASDSDSELIKAGKFSRVVRVLMDEGFDFAEAVKEAMRQGYNQGGRIGFESGANKMIEEKIAELEFLTNKLMEEQGIQDRGYASKLATDIIRMKNEDIDSDRLKFLNNESSLFALPRDIRPEDEYYDTLKALENRADGGRIGFESGANEMIKTQLLEEIMPDTSTEDMIMIMTEDGPKMIKRSDFEAMPGMFRDTTTSVFGDAGRGRRIPEELRADGGRIGFKKGSPEETSEIGIMAIDVEAGDDEDEEDMMMAYSDAIFNRREKGALFRALGDPRIRQTTGSFKDLDNLLKNPGMFPEREFILKEYLKIKGYADGGRIGLKGGGTDKMEQYKKYVSDMIKDGETPVDFEEFLEMTNYKDGGRIGLKGGSGSSNRVAQLILERDYLLSKDEDVSYIDAELESLGYKMKSEGGVMDVKMPTGKIRKNNAGVVERDYRDEGGFVPVGIKERADDVPAMLSKNEFVMTADAVRGIGNGSVEEGSKKLYNTMKKAEQVGKA